MEVKLIDYMGDDLRVVNAARVSFNKESNELSEADIKLINYLAKHNHWTPFSHVMITMRETVPIFVARQRFKHMVGFTYNEVSRRYVDEAPRFYHPDVWRGRAENKKQGSSDEAVEEITFHNYSDNWVSDPGYAYSAFIEQVTMYYNDLIAGGVAPEQARMVLPQSMYTEYYVSGSLAAWARAYKLRSDPHAQMEIQELAKQWDEIIGSIEKVRHSWNALIQ